MNLRNHTAKQYRSIRKILRGKEPEVFDQVQLRDRTLTWVLVIAGILVMLALFIGCEPAHAYTVDQIATAIGKAENSKTHPYGIMTRYWHTTPRQACINTIRHYLRDWRKSTQETGIEQGFIPYLASHYAPIGASNDPKGLNRNWIKNVSYFLQEGI